MEYELYHHGILGMKWGIRRYQNPDGSLTPAGRRRLQENARKVNEAKREYERAGFFKRGKAREKYDKALNKYEKFASKLEYNKMSDQEILDKSKQFMANQKVTSVATSQNVAAGERSLEDKIKLYSAVVTAATSTVNLVNQTRQMVTAAKIAKQESELKERKQLIEESKEKREWQKYQDDKAAAERKYRDDRADTIARNDLDAKIKKNDAWIRERQERRAAIDFNNKRSDSLRDYADKKALERKEEAKSSEIWKLGQIIGNLKAENAKLQSINSTQKQVNSEFLAKNKALERKADQLIHTIAQRDVGAMRSEASHNAKIDSFIHELNLKSVRIGQLSDQNNTLRRQNNKLRNRVGYYGG